MEGKYLDDENDRNTDPMSDYESTPVPQYQPPASGVGVSSQNIGGSIVSGVDTPTRRGFYTPVRRGSTTSTFPLSICVDGTPMTINVYTSDAPH